MIIYNATFSNLRAYCKKETRTCYKNNLEQTQNHLKANPWYFSKFIKCDKVSNKLLTFMFFKNY